METDERGDGQAWFWKPDWLEGESEANDDLVAGRFTRLNDDEALIAALGDGTRSRMPR